MHSATLMLFPWKNVCNWKTGMTFDCSNRNTELWQWNCV